MNSFENIQSMNKKRMSQPGLRALLNYIYLGQY